MSVAPRDRVRSQSSAGVLDAVGLAVVLAPLAIGSVHIEARLILATFSALACAYVWLRPMAMLPLVRVVGWTALVWLAWSLLTLIPMSPAVISALSERSAETYATASSLVGGEVQPSLSPDRPRTAAALMTLLFYGLIIATVWGRSLEASAHGTARSRIPLYVIFAGALSALVAAAHTALGSHELYGLYTPITSLDTQPLRGPMVNSNHTAALLLLTSCVTFGVWLQVREQRRYALLAGVWAMMVAGIVVSASRANLALAVVVHVYLFWHVRRGQPGSRQRLVGSLLGGMTVTGVLVVAFGNTLVPELQGGTAAVPSVFRSLIVERWHTAWGVLLEQPWFGHGPGAFGLVAPQHTASWLHGYMDRAHNLPLQLATEWGVPVALLLLAVGGMWLWRLLTQTYDKPSRHAAAVGLTAVLAQNMVDFSLLIPGVGVAWCVTAAWLSTTVGPTKVTRAAMSWSRALVLIACVSVLGVLGVLSYDGDPARADASVRAAAPTETWRNTLTRTIGTHPADFHLHTLGSAVARTRGEADLAHQLGQRALALAPRAPAVLRNACLAAFAAGERSAGRQALDQLCRLPPIHGPDCLGILVAERHQEGLIAEVVSTDAALTLALAEHLRQRGHREAMTKVLTWGRHTFPEDLDVHEALVTAWLRVPGAAKALDKLSVDILARSAQETDMNTQRRMQRLGYLVQGRLLELEKRYLEARHLYQEAAVLDPTRATEPLFRAASVLLRLEDMDRLDEVLDSLRKSLDPKDTMSRVSYHRLRSRANHRAGHLREAVTELHKAIRLRPNDHTLYDSLSQVLSSLGDERGARRAKDQATRYR